MYLRVEPIKELGTRMNVPASKPETQRAILAATLADGTSIIRNDLRCTETETMKIACAQLGAKIEEAADALFVTGTGGRFASGIEVIDAKGSGLVFRTMMALSCMKSTPTILTGDATLRRRVMQPLLDGLRHLGANFAYLGDEGKAPVINWGASLTGRHCRLAGDISSQFITAILMAAPLTRQGISLEVTPPVLSQSYLAQTVETLRQCGIDAQVNPEYTRYHVAPGVYQPFETRINADYTSLSYLLMACALFPGRYRIGGIEQETLQGEKLFADIVQALGAQLRYEAGALHVDSTSARLEGNYTFDVRDGPNVIPTLVALSLFVRGTFTVTGGIGDALSQVIARGVDDRRGAQAGRRYRHDPQHRRPHRRLRHARPAALCRRRDAQQPRRPSQFHVAVRRVAALRGGLPPRWLRRCDLFLS
ncbi:3-phosphoshikimate 1-carboxyvinyltransferase [Achromobacter xylosoxidans]|nr:3-phosphoshikimate 1-carboxyvinyltransferase [Achromobacter xylosoxidans]